eukprot:SAG22_NODE_156_length_16999_cov_8.168047_2_plen_66_part_00
MYAYACGYAFAFTHVRRYAYAYAFTHVAASPVDGSALLLLNLYRTASRTAVASRYGRTLLPIRTC